MLADLVSLSSLVAGTNPLADIIEEGVFDDGHQEDRNYN